MYFHVATILKTGPLPYSMIMLVVTVNSFPGLPRILFFSLCLHSKCYCASIYYTKHKLRNNKTGGDWEQGFGNCTSFKQDIHTLATSIYCQDQLFIHSCNDLPYMSFSLDFVSLLVEAHQHQKYKFHHHNYFTERDQRC